MVDIPWAQAIQRVLSEAGGPLHYAEIAERVSSLGLRKNVGATPAMTVAAYISNGLKEGDSSILRLGRGMYALAPSSVTQEPPASAAIDDLEETDTGALRSFGMFWLRDQVAWVGKSRLLGRQSSGAASVNFADQVGVYLLHDRDRVIYVGRAADTLYARLKAHTVDRLGGRWDRFSWFGLRDVDVEGGLVDKTVPWSETVVIETLEALLIESLEPPLNRRRGDNLSAAEYLQVPDPTVEGARLQAMVDRITKGG